MIYSNKFLVYHKDCQQMALPFLCQYYFPLYDCPNGDIYTASREDCIDISTGICASLWNLAINYGYGDRLPDCQELPSCKYSSLYSVMVINFGKIASTELIVILIK